MLFRKLREGSAGFLVIWKAPISGDYRLATAPRLHGGRDDERSRVRRGDIIEDLRLAMKRHADYAVMSGLEGPDLVIERIAGFKDKAACVNAADPCPGEAHV